MKTKIIPGDVFGLWTILERVENDKYGNTQWLCKCVCGTVKTKVVLELRSGRSKSCGCKRKTHGQGHIKTYYYRAWDQMMQRCYNPNNLAYKFYGEIGRQVYEPWHKFETFYKDIINEIGHRPNDKTLDRWPNPNGNYEPGNIRWATRAQQGQNQKLKNTNKSGVRGVYLFKRDQKWHAQITVNNKQIHLGYFTDLIEAAKVYDSAALKYHRDSAVTNKSRGVY